MFGKSPERDCRRIGMGFYSDLRLLQYQERDKLPVSLWETLNFTVRDWRRDATTAVESSNFESRS